IEVIQMTVSAVQSSHHYYYRFSWIQLLRPLTLSGTISPICVSSLFIYLKTDAIHIKPLLLLLISTLLIQVSTNIWNDYFDFKKGQDQMKWQTESVRSFQLAHHQLPYIAASLTTVAIITGIWLASLTTIWLIPIGVSGIICGIYYSAGNPSLSQVGLGEA